MWQAKPFQHEKTMKLILTKKHLFTIYRSATIRIRKTFYKPTTQKLYPLIARPRPRAKRLTFIYQCKPGFWKPEEHAIVLLCIIYYKKKQSLQKNNFIKLIVLVRQKRKLSKAEKIPNLLKMAKVLKRSYITSYWARSRKYARPTISTNPAFSIVVYYSLIIFQQNPCTIFSQNLQTQEFCKRQKRDVSSYLRLGVQDNIIITKTYYYKTS